jgi:hypothetical protein
MVARWFSVREHYAPKVRTSIVQISSHVNIEQVVGSIPMGFAFIFALDVSACPLFAV